MRIENSAVAMSSYRSYTAEVEGTESTISRVYHGDALMRESVHAQKIEASVMEAEGGTSYYTTSKEGVSRRDDGRANYQHMESKPVENKQENQGAPVFQALQPASQRSWLGDFNFRAEDSAEIKLLKRMLELLRKFTGKEDNYYTPDYLAKDIEAASNTFQFSASAASVRYQETMALFSGGANGSVEPGIAVGQSEFNGVWTRQVIQSGFAAGQETTAFCSKGSVMTSDGRSIDFNISVEMSRSFAAAYEITGEEAIYTDPLIINMDTSSAELADVSFRFDLDADGNAEEISGLDWGSGFLALDKNGDGTINNGSELFGARTGDGFGELAAYDQDGNGWIDENDDVFSKLSVWVKCGTEDARLLSLKEADVGAIFLGNQRTNYSLTGENGEEGARIRQTGIYLKESGSVGTVQHVDFKA